ncbi:sensor histidine kinase [Streptomyces hirsutus]|uniref:anti-sigma factor RsbA family regulatory protein n=1 Tax=Streptomyces hirsutus TaxID=35620 RepID=UPI00386B64A1|nr:sensor histidine kinase [Streptomyces hirsutus]
MTDRLTAPSRPHRGSGLSHQGLIYGSGQEFLATTVPFCLEGLEQRDAVPAVTTPANIDLLRQALGDASGQVEFIDAGKWYRTPGRTLGASYRYVDQRTGTGRHQRVRVIGEPVWHGRHTLETTEWTRYESAINVAFAHCPAWIICPCDARALPESFVADARRTHPHLAVAASARPSDRCADPATDNGRHRPLAPVAGEGEETFMRFGADLSAVRSTVVETAAEMGLSADGTQRLVFAVNEVATNAVQHGGGTGHIVVRRAGRRIVCDVASTGRNKTDWYLGHLPPDPQQQRGHGMWVVRQLCDLLEVHTGQDSTTVRLHVSLA